MSEPDQNANDAAFQQASALGDEGERLALAGRYADALPVLGEAMRLHWSITGPHPSLILVIATLSNLGFCLGKLQQHRAAVEVLTEAQRLCEPLVQAAFEIDVVRDTMAKTLGGLGHSLALLGEFEPAVAVTTELVRLRRSLFEPGPLQVDFDLGKDLRLFALARARVGVDGESANAAIGESVQIFQQLAQQDGAKYGRELITTYDVLAEVLDLLGRGDEAQKLRGHLVTQYEALAQAMEQAGRGDEAEAIRSYSKGLDAKA